MAESIISPGVYARENDVSYIQPQPIAAGAAFLGPTVKGPDNFPTVITSYSDYTRKFGDTFTSGSRSYEFLTSIAVKNYFSQGGQTALVTRVVSGTYGPAENTYISCNTGSLNSPFKIKTLGKGTLYNNAALSGSAIAASASYINLDGSLITGSADNIRWEITNVNNSLGTFALSVRRGDDNTNNKTVLETFNNISLDPNSPNYIEAVIGTQYVTTNASDGPAFIEVKGAYPNRSNYIRVEEGFGIRTPNYLANDGIAVNTDLQSNSYSGSLPTASSGSFLSGLGALAVGAKFFTEIGTNAQGLVAANYVDAIDILGNRDDYQFNTISAPGIIHDKIPTVTNKIIALAEQRGDCIAVVDLVATGAIIKDVTDAATGLNSSYAASYWPWVQVKSATGRNEYVPAGTLVPGAFAFTDASSAPWFAPAGLVRGGLPGVIQAERKLSKGDRDVLYAAKVNPVATFPGTGIAIFGQKTLQSKASALDRVNVRRLLIELKKFIGDQAKNLVFEQNSISTRNKFLSIVNPYLSSVVQRQGLYAFRIVMDDTNNTADVVDRNQIVGQILIQPTKTIEFVVLDFTIEPTGATFT